MTKNESIEQGHELSKIREFKGLSLEQLAQRVGVSKSYLSKIEKGQRPLPDALLGKLAEVYKDSARFAALVGGHKVNINEGERRLLSMDTSNQLVQRPPEQQLQINLNAEKTPVLYSDWHQISTNDGGIVLSFGQSAAPTPMMMVISRVGLSHAQAKELYNTLGKNLQEYFKSKNMEF
jgi:transcriptional regulator with XRE-family HTH domain